jgi:hypothetical protein
MDKQWRFLRGLKFFAIVTLFIGVIGWVFMTLWNVLIPEIFGARVISYWQAIGLLIMGRLMFGGRGFGPGHWKHHSRWERMTPEEREKFRSGIRSRWCREPEGTTSDVTKA